MLCVQMKIKMTEDCEAGQYFFDNKCFACDDGTYQNVKGKTFCNRIRAGQYATSASGTFSYSLVNF